MGAPRSSLSGMFLEQLDEEHIKTLPLISSQ